MSLLFTPLAMRGVTFRNRITVSPMCQYSSEDGFANDWHFVHLGSRAVGGAGLVIVEATAVEDIGRISPQDMGLWKDEHVEPLARINRFMAQHGAVPGIQLAHAGRKASTQRPWEGNAKVGPEAGGWTPVAPSAIKFKDDYPEPVALDKAGIQRITRLFVEATERALKAGFRVIELHAAHGYLLHEFLSPLANKRTDEYGGSFENRVRFLLETVKAMRARMPEELPLFVRISATDWVEGGWNLDESVALARLLKPLGVDLIDCSSAAMVPHAPINYGPGYQTPFAERIRRETGMATGAVGYIRSPLQAEHILHTGQADLIILAREMLRDPYWPVNAARELDVKATLPPQYWSVQD
jgi:2,4-dienoyl-CoA reductase-like NADH-dependent reductase (Old Yellow Enzyme family)